MVQFMDIKLRRLRDDNAYAVAQRPLGGVILQVRARASAAHLRAWIFLATLVLIVLGGLAFYLLLPFWQIYADGSKRALQANLLGLQQQQLDIDDARELILDSHRHPSTDSLPADAGFAQALHYVPELVSQGNQLFGGYALAIGAAILLIDNHGSVQRSGDGGKTFSTVFKPADPFGEYFGEPPALKGLGLLSYGESGTILRSDDGNKFALVDSKIFEPSTRFDADHQVAHVASGNLIVWYDYNSLASTSLNGGATFQRTDLSNLLYPHERIAGGCPADDAVLLYGDFGTVLSISKNGGKATRIVTGPSHGLNGSAVLGKTIVLFGQSGAVQVSHDGGRTFNQQQMPFAGITVDLADGMQSDGVIVLVTSSGNFARSVDNGDTFEFVKTNAGLSYANIITGIEFPGNPIVVFGDEGDALVLNSDASSFRMVPREAPELAFRTSFRLGDLVLYFAAGGKAKRSLDGGKTADWIETGLQGFSGSINGVVEMGGSLILYGDNGIVARSDDNGAHFAKLDSGTTVDLQQDITLADGRHFLIGSDDGSVLQLTDQWSTAATALKLEPERDGDAQLDAFLAGLPAYVRQSGPVAEVIGRWSLLKGNRATVEHEIAVLNEQIEALDRNWFSALTGQRAQLNFDAFMASCRGKADPPDGTLTSTCLNAYNANSAYAEGTWWAALTRQVPAGVLLMFMLVTLGGLYRYNLRLAAFHESRADILEMVSLDRDAPAIRRYLEKQPNDLNRLAMAMGADRIDLGTMRAKVANAEIELADSAAKIIDAAANAATKPDDPARKP